MKKLLLILSFIVTGTSIAEQKLTRPLVHPPQFLECEETKGLLTCGELQVTVCEPTGFQFCDDNSTHPYCVRFYGNYYEYYGGVVQTPYNSKEKTTNLLHLKPTN